MEGRLCELRSVARMLALRTAEWRSGCQRAVSGATATGMVQKKSAMADEGLWEVVVEELLRRMAVLMLEVVWSTVVDN